MMEWDYLYEWNNFWAMANGVNSVELMHNNNRRERTKNNKICITRMWYIHLTATTVTISSVQRQNVSETFSRFGWRWCCCCYLVQCVYTITEDTPKAHFSPIMKRKLLWMHRGKKKDRNLIIIFYRTTKFQIFHQTEQSNFYPFANFSMYIYCVWFLGFIICIFMV